MLAVVSATTLSGVVDAKPTPKKNLKKAELIFQEAEVFAADQKYKESAAKYMEAYALYPASDFLFNAAEMFKYAGDKAQAVEHYKRYLSEAPEGRGAAEAKSSLSTLEAELAKEEQAKREKDDLAAAEARKAAQENDLVEQPEKNIRKTSDAGSSNGSTVRIAGLAGLGLGTVLVGVGVYYGLESGRISDEVSMSTNFMPELEAEGEDAQRNAFIFSGVGAATAITGALLYFVVGKKNGESSSLSFFPSLQHDSVAAMAVGSF